MPFHLPDTDSPLLSSLEARSAVPLAAARWRQKQLFMVGRKKKRQMQDDEDENQGKMMVRWSLIPGR